MPQGSLIVRVTASGGSIPIENASVTVYNAAGESEVIAVRYTDKDGRTDTIFLDAPPRSLSESPDSGGIKPYSVYNVNVKKDGFYEVFNREVPIFDGVLAILPVNMIPMPAENSGMLTPRSGIVIRESEPNLSGEVEE